jgi:hypothetical protein
MEKSKAKGESLMTPRVSDCDNPRREYDQDQTKTPDPGSIDPLVGLSVVRRDSRSGEAIHSAKHRPDSLPLRRLHGEPIGERIHA